MEKTSFTEYTSGEAAPAVSFTKKLTQDEFNNQSEENTINGTLNLCKSIARKEIKKEENDKFIVYFERKYITNDCIFDTTNLSNDLKRYYTIFKLDNDILVKDNKSFKELLEDNKDMMKDVNIELDEVEQKNKELQSIVQTTKIAKITNLIFMQFHVLFNTSKTNLVKHSIGLCLDLLVHKIYLWG